MSHLPNAQHVLDAQTRIAGHVRTTPVLVNESLNQIAGARLYLKAECLQQTGSFKLRGATNRLLKIPDTQRDAGVVAFSSGNHAQGVARAARHLGIPAVIVMPRDAPDVKIKGVEADGAEIVPYDRIDDNREVLARDIATDRGAILVPSFDDADIIAGQGTCGLEFLQQLQADSVSLDHLLCCAGGGGLITGMALAFEAMQSRARIWTCEPQGHDDWARSLADRTRRRNSPGTHSICDAILTPQPGVLTWQLGVGRLSGGCVVEDEAICAAMYLAFKHLKLVLEPGGAAALAAALFALPEEAKGSAVGVVLTGANVDPETYIGCIQTGSRL